MKVLGTTGHIPYKYWKKVEEILGETIPRNEFRIICKCKGMRDANEKCSSLGLYPKTFKQGFSCETANKQELEVCEQGEVFIAKTQGNPIVYVDVSRLL